MRFTLINKKFIQILNLNSEQTWGDNGNRLHKFLYIVSQDLQSKYWSLI